MFLTCSDRNFTSPIQETAFPTLDLVSARKNLAKFRLNNNQLARRPNFFTFFEEFPLTNTGIVVS